MELKVSGTWKKRGAKRNGGLIVSLFVSFIMSTAYVNVCPKNWVVQTNLVEYDIDARYTN